MGTMLKRIVKPEDIANAMLFLAVHPRHQRTDAGGGLRARLMPTTPFGIDPCSVYPADRADRRRRIRHR